MGASDRFDRRPLAVAVTTDGRRLQVPVGADEATPLSLIRSIVVVVESLIGLIAGRRESGGQGRSRE